MATVTPDSSGDWCYYLDTGDRDHGEDPTWLGERLKRLLLISDLSHELECVEWFWSLTIGQTDWHDEANKRISTTVSYAPTNNISVVCHESATILAENVRNDWFLHRLPGPAPRDISVHTSYVLNPWKNRKIEFWSHHRSGTESIDVRVSLGCTVEVVSELTDLLIVSAV